VTDESPARSSMRAGILVKRLALAFGGTYLAMVSLTNLVNFVASVAGVRWALLNSGNSDYIASIVKIYALPSWTVEVFVLGAALIEGFGAVLFVRAIVGLRGDGTGMAAALQALAWNIGVWFAFIMGTEFFIAYPAESPFRELLALGFLMTLVVTLVPDGPRNVPAAP